MVQLNLANDYLLVANLVGDSVRTRKGSMVAYVGNVDFKYAGSGGGKGIRGSITRAVTGESLPLMECKGHGTVYLADSAAHITLIDLAGEKVQVESDSILALNGNINTGVEFAGLHGMAGGAGLFTTNLTGQGQVALLSRGGPPIGLEVSPSSSLVVDPDAFIAAIGNLQKSIVSDVNFRSVVSGGTGEEFSVRFDGTGVVWIQPDETGRK